MEEGASAVERFNWAGSGDGVGKDAVLDQRGEGEERWRSSHCSIGNAKIVEM